MMAAVVCVSLSAFRHEVDWLSVLQFVLLDPHFVMCGILYERTDQSLVPLEHSSRCSFSERSPFPIINPRLSHLLGQ